MPSATIICPGCRGSKIDQMTSLSCTWCKGTKTVPPETAARYAETMKRLAMDGMISGHNVGGT